MSTRVSSDLAAVMKTNAKVKKTLENFAPSHKRDYIQWITETKRDFTRQKRLETTIQWLSEGKRRNWKYESC
ncbi:MAG: YdeI/OmpD-associated family protein [Planctomycetota bacterium]